MEITCPNCLKIFIVDESLIPKEGRLVKCSNCENEWFYKSIDKNTEINPIKNKITAQKDLKAKNFKINDTENISNEVDADTDTNNENNTEDYSSDYISSKDIEKKSPILYLKYTIVFIISFVSLIIILDTFKKPLSIILPNLEIILQNFYETLKDVFLFLKDLIN